MKKIQLLVCFSLLIILGVNAQSDQKSSLSLKIDTINENFNSFKYFTFSTIQDYQFHLVGFNSNAFSSKLSFRLEEELYASETYKVWQEVSFIDFNFSYSVEQINFSFGIENLLNFGSQNFSIEPDLVNNNVAFIQEDDFLISTSITYNF